MDDLLIVQMGPEIFGDEIHQHLARSPERFLARGGQPDTDNATVLPGWFSFQETVALEAIDHLGDARLAVVEALRQFAHGQRAIVDGDLFEQVLFGESKTQRFTQAFAQLVREKRPGVGEADPRHHPVLFFDRHHLYPPVLSMRKIS